MTSRNMLVINKTKLYFFLYCIFKTLFFPLFMPFVEKITPHESALIHLIKE
jgi:hypothetical protein